MGIERFYTQSVYVYSFTSSATWPHDESWTQITGSPFKASVTELSGDRAKVGGAIEARADIVIDMSTATTMSSAYKVKWNSRNFDIVNIKLLTERAGHHQEVYCAENKSVVLP